MYFCLPSKRKNLVRDVTDVMYNHTETGEALVYYRSQREFSLPVKQLGEGTHRFQAYIYPNVTGWESRVSSIPLDKTVILREYLGLPGITQASTAVCITWIQQL